MNDFSKELVSFVRDQYGTKGAIPLHAPCFDGKEKEYLLDVIDSTFVSTVGECVTRFETKVAEYTGAKYAVAVVNGTSALHVALIVAGVQSNDEVITQSLTFVATCNAIRYCGAEPVFVDVDRCTLGMSPDSLESFLGCYAEIRDDGLCWNKKTGRVIKACVPMHNLGHPVKLVELKKICHKYNIQLVEDSAESLGSFYDGKHTGTIGKLSAISFNGNKVITAGGGGCIITDSEILATKAKHITTTAKEPHKWEYSHDMIGYNYRMPNLNAALIVAQLEQLDRFLKSKRNLANQYKEFFNNSDIEFVMELERSKSNYWLNAIILKNRKQRDLFLEETNSEGVMTRPIWTLMNKLRMFRNSQHGDLKNSEWLEQRVVNIPSSVTTS